MKPILFNTEMVKGILEGRKTCTRRVVKPRYKADEYGFQVCINKATGERWVEKIDEDDCGIFADGTIRYVNAPYKIGDILYVRETWLKADDGYFYRANATPISEEVRKDFGYKWKPSIHMPKIAARIFLKVKNVRVERLQDITEEGSRKEGCIDFNDKISNGKFEDVLEFDLTARDAFIELWNTTVNKKDINLYGWDANPWVWVIEFENLDNYKI